MIRTVNGIVLLILHLTVCILIWAGIRSGMLKVKKIPDNTCDFCTCMGSFKHVDPPSSGF